MPRSHTRRVITVILTLALVTAVPAGVSTAEHATSEAFFEVEITNVNTTVTEGESVVVAATVTNTGDAEGSQQIHLKDFDDEIVTSIAQPPLTLAPGEHENVTLTWETGLYDAGSDEISVHSNDERSDRTIDITKGDFIDVTVDRTNAPIAAGEQLTMTANVTTPRETIVVTPLRLTVGDSLVDEKRVVLMHGEKEQVELTWNSTEHDIGDNAITVESNGGHESITITVEDPNSTTEMSSEPDTTEADGEPATETDTEAQSSASETTDTAGSTEPGQSATIEEQSGFGIGLTLAVLAVVGLGIAVASTRRPN